MKHKEARGMWKPFFAKLKPVEVYSPGGLYLANSLEVSLDTIRLTRIVNRIIRGLFFKLTNAALPVGDYTRSMSISQYREEAQRRIGKFGIDHRAVAAEGFLAKEHLSWV